MPTGDPCNKHVLLALNYMQGTNEDERVPFLCQAHSQEINR